MVNKVILIGNLGRDPELTYTPSGVAVCRVSLATTERWNNKDGNRQESTEWHNLVFWRRHAEVANEYLRKGSRIFVEGRIRYRSYDDRDGNKRNVTDIEVQNFQMLSSRGESAGGGSGGRRSEYQENRPQQGAPQQGAPQQGAPQQGAPQQPKQDQGGQDDGYRYEPYQNDQDYGSADDKDLPF